MDVSTVPQVKLIKEVEMGEDNMTYEYMKYVETP
jgi:hypothetical protein